MRGIALYYIRYQNRDRGKTKVESVLKVMPNGNVRVIDLTRMTFRENKTFGSLPMRLKLTNSREWNKAKKKLIDHINKL